MDRMPVSEEPSWDDDYQTYEQCWLVHRPPINESLTLKAREICNSCILETGFRFAVSRFASPSVVSKRESMGICGRLIDGYAIKRTC